MTESLLHRTIIPIANEEDTRATCEALLPHLDDTVEMVNLLYVIEQTEGYMDTTTPEALEQEAHEWFKIAEGILGTVDGFQTELRAGTDVVDEIVVSAVEHDATAIVFKPREKGQLSRLLSRGVKERLLTESPCPVVTLPDTDKDGFTEISD